MSRTRTALAADLTLVATAGLPAVTTGGASAAAGTLHVDHAPGANCSNSGPGTDGHLIVYPGDEFMPSVSNLNFQAGETVANQVVVKVNEGHITIRNASAAPVHIVVDLFGTQSY
ncbi:hypothetical protein [Kitasatospora purpeofusca]|uniref:hypothetical protein n=1 Tax=Kitasatospora purpeofusca TaxID=67352 RepID=UPI00386DFC6C|nr:hypothetical protein OIP63_24620 [Kitasatospora purpeofusca]